MHHGETAENCKKFILIVRQKLKLHDKFENGELAPEVARGYGVGIQLSHPLNDAAGLTFSEFLLMKTI